MAAPYFRVIKQDIIMIGGCDGRVHPAPSHVHATLSHVHVALSHVMVMLAALSRVIVMCMRQSPVTCMWL